MAYPTAIEREYGNGKIIYMGFPIENEGYIIYQRIIRNIIDRYVGLNNLSVKTKSPTDVETVVFRDENDFLRRVRVWASVFSFPKSR